MKNFLSPLSIFIFIVFTLPLSSKAQENRLEHFSFHTDAAQNLHHILYHLARAQSGERLRGRVRLKEEDRAMITPDVLEKLQPAIDHYKKWIRLSPLFDEELGTIRKELIEGSDNLSDEYLKQDFNIALASYKETLWPKHLKDLEAFEEKLITRAKPLEDIIAFELTTQLEGIWPKDPIRVDLLAYAHWAGAYTDNNPDQIVLSAYDEDLAGNYDVEILFHEAMHIESFGKLYELTNKILEEYKIERPRFWHAIQFNVTGSVIKKAFGDPNYIIYADDGPASRGNGPINYASIRAVWDTNRGLEDNIRASVEELKKRMDAEAN